MMETRTKETGVEIGSRILLLVDNMQSMQEISDTLIPAGYEIQYSIAGHNLTRLIHSKNFDLVLYNMTIEGLNGFDVLKKVKSSGLNSTVPVIFITDSTRKKNLMQGLHVSGIDFLKTPFSREELLTRINTQITLVQTNAKLEHSRSITKSIRYAERIQKAMVPSESLLECYFKEHYMINLPRDIVSGDFYWATEIDDLKLIALADCTGHGVPGAFLSVLGMSLLNEICSSKGIEDASGILDKLRWKLKNTLLRTEEHSPVSDGMDISLILVDTARLSLEFSGAYHKLLILREGEIIEFRGDPQPIGFHPVERNFTNRNIKLKKGDKIYMSTDGYFDQFGGQMGKKFQFRNYRRLIQEISSYDLQKQKAILLREHMEWKGINDQLDDILMLAIEI